MNLRMHVLRMLGEKMILGALIIATSLTVVMGVALVASLIWESVQFFQHVSPVHFLFGTYWNPSAIDDVLTTKAISNYFGAFSLFTGSLIITAIALAVAMPLSLLSAIYLRFYATNRQRALLKPMLELLSSIPTVIYGFLAMIIFGPILHLAMQRIGVVMGSESALVAGSVMGLMIVPLIASISDDVMASQNVSLRDGALALGATHSEAIRSVILPGSLPGIVQGIMLALSRALGETMLVVMAAGLGAQLTFNPLESMTTVTVQIVALLSGDQSFESPATHAAFALGLVLFGLTLTINTLAAALVRRLNHRLQ